ncbi:uncharacterized protein LOC134249738 [Saccostrea cucullata]|uniref:uncharacterized protein LOC134249738 n=1 Tax=Saccostrea cuccullata TaxID=36930 RepID=UPI002ED1F80D
MSPILVLILSLLCISRAAVITTEKPKGCMYDGKFYETGIIKKTVDGDCVSDITCHDNGFLTHGESLGCLFRDLPLPPPPTTKEPELPPPTPSLWRHPPNIQKK